MTTKIAMNDSDKLYAQSRKLVDAFKFDADVARVFSDMISRSAPGYHLMLDVLGVLTDKTIQQNDTCYDLGCSLGASTLAIRHNIHHQNCRIFAIDNSAPMLERCQAIIQADTALTPVITVNQDIEDIIFEPCKLVSLNLTLQFIQPSRRLPLLQNIANALTPGGVLFLSEKVQFDNSFEQTQLTDLHHQFKKHQGYSDLEIAQKRSSIENILIPETIHAHKKRLLEAGFTEVITALQCFNFVGLIAYK